MKNQNPKSSKGVMLTEAQWERCDRLANEMGCRSRNAFIRDAIDFYCSWLEKEQSERFLTPALESVISAKIRDSEERINRNLFKIAVDLAILAKIVLNEDGGGYDEDYLADLRRDSIREVSETNGAINNLTGLIIMNNQGLDHGAEFENFINKFFDSDDEALNKLIKALSKI